MWNYPIKEFLLEAWYVIFNSSTVYMIFVNETIYDIPRILDWLQIDNSVVESFGAQGRTCITSRVYPNIAIYDNAHMFVFNNGTEPITIDSLDAWSMKAPSVMNN